MGNTVAVAQAHYLQVTDTHFAEAARDPGEDGPQKAQQQGAEWPCTASHAKEGAKQNRPVLPGGSASCESLHEGMMTPTGFEPVSRP